MSESRCLYCKAVCEVVKGTVITDPVTNEPWGLCAKCKKFSGTSERLLNLALKLSDIKRRFGNSGGDVDAR